MCQVKTFDLSRVSVSLANERRAESVQQTCVSREGMKVWRGFEDEILQSPLAQLQKMDFSQPCDEYQLHVLDVSPINRVTKSPSERINMCMVAPWLASAGSTPSPPHRSNRPTNIHATRHPKIRANYVLRSAEFSNRGCVKLASVAGCSQKVALMRT